MRVRDYIFGQRLVLRSPLLRDEVQARINRASGSVFSPFGAGVAGWARLGRLSLKVRDGPFEYNAKPRLWGSIRDVPEGTEFSVRFGGPVGAVAFLAFMYFVLGLISISLIAAYVTGDEGLNREVFPFALLLLAAFMIGPIVMHVFGTRGSEQELEQMLGFLEHEVEAEIQPAYSLEGQR